MQNRVAAMALATIHITNQKALRCSTLRLARSELSVWNGTALFTL